MSKKEINKQDLTALLQEKCSYLNKTQANEVVSTLVDIIMGQVAEGNKVKLIGFGTFERAERQERISRNPKTGQTFMAPPKSLPRFKSGQTFKKLLAS